MAEKIILFLSILNTAATPASYTYKGDCETETVTGTQTNEAPVKWLLRKHPDISEVICLCSTESPKEIPRKNKDGGSIAQSAWGHFSEDIGRFGKKNALSVQCFPISYEAEESLERDILPRLMEHIAPDDVIYLDLTGGMRNDNLNLFLLSRVLNYTGVTVRGAVYSNFQTKQVEDVSHLIHLFDLVEGVQDFTSFGSVRKLRDYFGSPAEDEAVEKLLSAMETLINNITICRSKSIKNDLESFNKALNQAKHCGNPLLEQLLPTFRSKYCKRKENQITLPELISWCLDSDMIQQALTLYTERIPAYLVEEHFLTVGALEDSVNTRINAEVRKSHRDKMSIQFDTDLLYRGQSCRPFRYAPCAYAKTIECLSEALNGTPYVLNRSEHEMQEILRDYIYLKMIRNMINHANDQNAENRKSQEDYLHGYGYPSVDQISLADIRRVLTTAIHRLA